MALKEGTFGRYWELLKYEGKYLRSCGVVLSKLNRISEEQIVSEIAAPPDRLSPEERLIHNHKFDEQIH